MHRICSIFRNCSVITSEAQHIHSIPPFHCPLHCPTHCLERCFAYTDVRRYSTLYKPLYFSYRKINLSSSPFHVQFSLKPQLALHFSSFHVFLDLVHLEHCPTAILSIPSPVQYPCCLCAALFFLHPPTQLGHSRLSCAHLSLSSNLNPSHSK